MEVTLDQSKSGDCEHEYHEADPLSIEFAFLKTGGSQEHGVLFTHHKAFKFHKQHANQKVKVLMTWQIFIKASLASMIHLVSLLTLSLTTLSHQYQAI